MLTGAGDKVGENGSVDTPARKKQKGRLLFTSIVVNDANSAYVSEGHVGPALVRQVSNRRVLCNLFVGIAHLIGQAIPYPILHACGKLDARRHQLIPAFLNDVVKFLALLHGSRDGVVQLDHELLLALQEFLTAGASVS